MRYFFFHSKEKKYRTYRKEEEERKRKTEKESFKAEKKRRGSDSHRQPTVFMALVLGNTVIAPNLRGRPWLYNTATPAVAVTTTPYTTAPPYGQYGYTVLPPAFLGERFIPEAEFLSSQWTKYGAPIPAIVGKDASGYGVFVGQHATIPGVFAFVRINPFQYVTEQQVFAMPKFTVTQTRYSGRRGVGAGVKMYGWMVWHFDRLTNIITFYVPIQAPERAFFRVPLADVLNRHRYIFGNNSNAYKAVRVFARRFGVAPLMGLRLQAVVGPVVTPYTPLQRKMLQAAITGVVIQDLESEGVHLRPEEKLELRRGVLHDIRKYSEPVPGETPEKYERRLALIGTRHAAKAKHHHKQASRESSLTPHEADKLLH